MEVDDIYKELQRAASKGKFSGHDQLYRIAEFIHKDFEPKEIVMERLNQKILATVTDLVSDFTYYDRKNDEELSEEILDNAIKNGTVTIPQIVQKFREELNNVYTTKNKK